MWKPTFSVGIALFLLGITVASAIIVNDIPTAPVDGSISTQVIPSNVRNGPNRRSSLFTASVRGRTARTHHRRARRQANEDKQATTKAPPAPPAGSVLKTLPAEPVVAKNSTSRPAEKRKNNQTDQPAQGDLQYYRPRPANGPEEDYAPRKEQHEPTYEQKQQNPKYYNQRPAEDEHPGYLQQPKYYGQGEKQQHQQQHQQRPSYEEGHNTEEEEEKNVYDNVYAQYPFQYKNGGEKQQHEQYQHKPVEGKETPYEQDESPKHDDEHPTHGKAHPKPGSEYPKPGPEYPKPGNEYQRGPEYPRPRPDYPKPRPDYPRPRPYYPNPGAEYQPGHEYPKPGPEYLRHDQEYPKKNTPGEYPSLGEEYPKGNGEYPRHGGEYPRQGEEYPRHGREYPRQGEEYPRRGGEYPRQGEEYPRHGGEYSRRGEEYPRHGGEHPQYYGEDHPDSEEWLPHDDFEGPHDYPQQPYGKDHPDSEEWLPHDDFEGPHDYPQQPYGKDPAYGNSLTRMVCLQESSRTDLLAKHAAKVEVAYYVPPPPMPNSHNVTQRFSNEFACCGGNSCAEAAQAGDDVFASGLRQAAGNGTAATCTWNSWEEECGAFITSKTYGLEVCAGFNVTCTFTNVSSQCDPAFLPGLRFVAEGQIAVVEALSCQESYMSDTLLDLPISKLMNVVPESPVGIASATKPAAGPSDVFVGKAEIWTGAIRSMAAPKLKNSYTGGTFEFVAAFDGHLLPKTVRLPYLPFVRGGAMHMQLTKPKPQHHGVDITTGYSSSSQQAQ